MAIALRFTARTDVGLVRGRNEDSGYAGPHLLAVADGMGGHAGGNVASSTVMAHLAPLDGDSHGADSAVDLLVDAIAEGNAAMAQTAAADASLAGMGTTLTAIMRAGATALALVHIGDSRAYRLRDDQVSQITKDHSFVQALVDQGELTPEEALSHPRRALVMRVLTGQPTDVPDTSIIQARVGDRYLICSDGLSDYVATATIHDVLKAGLGVDETASRLVDLALRAGAPDNVTVVLADVVNPETSPPVQPFVVGAVAERVASGPQAPLSPAAKAAALRREANGVGDHDDDVVLAEEGGGRPWRAILAGVLAMVALVAGGFAAYDWNQRQRFLGESEGLVALYKGVHQDLGAIRLYQVTEKTEVPLADLPDYFREAVQSTIAVSDDAALTAKLTELRAAAATCRTVRLAGGVCGSPVTGAVAPSATSSSSASSTPPNLSTSPSTGSSTGGSGPANASATAAGALMWPADPPASGGRR